MNVLPYVKDITHELVPGTMHVHSHDLFISRPPRAGNNQIWYYATYDGQPPHETGGYIVMSSYLVYWSVA